MFFFLFFFCLFACFFSGEVHIKCTSLTFVVLFGYLKMCMRNVNKISLFVAFVYLVFWGRGTCFFFWRGVFRFVLFLANT